MRLTEIIVITFLAILFGACALKDENPKPKKPIDSTSKLMKSSIEDTLSQKDSNYVELTFIEKNKDLFVENRIDSFLVPDYYFFEKYSLATLTDSSFINSIYNFSNIDRYNAKMHYYSIENRLNNFQDFTVFIINDYSYNIVYCIMNEENHIVSTLVVAYQFSEGEYSEYASGRFINDNEYRLFIEGVAEPFEDGEEFYEGSTTVTLKKYIIDEAGMIEEI